VTFWNQVVEVLREAIFAYAHVSNGNLGVGILAVSFLARMALFPLTLRLARLAQIHQDRVRRIQPELDAVRARYRNDPRRLAEETRRVFSREHLSMVPLSGLLGGIVQTPVLLALFSAVRQAAAVGGRFLWVANIAKPDVLVGIIVTALAVGSLAAAPQSGGQNRTVIIWLPALFTMIALSKMAAGIGLYWGVSSAVSVVQTLIVRHHRPTSAAV
jgi:YidC/Oxa1 family membrane protein insertase